MDIETIASFTASDLKQSGPILDAAAQGMVRIKRRGETFLLLREAQFDRSIREAANPHPKNISDLLTNYDADDVKIRLSSWNADAAAGKQVL